MGAAIGAVLPLAVGIAISPIPIIAVVLMLLSPHARTTAVGYAVGWVLGIIVATVVFTLLSAILPAVDKNTSRPVLAVIQLILGVLLLLVAVKQWRGRPGPGETPEMPKWMSAIDSMTAGKGLGLGLLLSCANPKNLMMAISAGVSIGGAAVNGWQSTVVVIIFVVIAACSVAIPVIAYLAAADKMRQPLDTLRSWLEHNNAVIMSVLLLVIGTAVIGKGIGGF
jgi:threonine/homoserine/homoserine lactone efflux protein